MRVVVRVDGDPRIGGGHVMRCLTLADALRERGAAVAFVTTDAPGGLASRIEAAGFGVHRLPVAAHVPPPAPPHAAWCRVPRDVDAAATGGIVRDRRADWLIWDHYGLDAEWVAGVRASNPGLRVLALDDLDDRPLASDMVLDQTRLGGVRAHPALSALAGPAHALLRPEFAALRPAALARRADAALHTIAVHPGMMDAAGLAPAALDALADHPARVEVAMGSAAQSVAATRARTAPPNRCLVLDAPDMAARMAAADLCVGAAGMTAWERACLGLPTVTVAVADNQRAVVAALAEAGAVVPLSLEAARDPARLRDAVAAAWADRAALSARAAALCDGRGAARVAAALSGRLRPLVQADAATMLAWRNAPKVVAATPSARPVDPQGHPAWLARQLASGARWRVWVEDGRDRGIVGAQPGEGWTWSFYAAPDAPRGAGHRMCAAFLREIAEADAAPVHAVVRADNPASIRLHERLGFSRVPSADPALLAFRRLTWDIARDLRLPEAP